MAATARACSQNAVRVLGHPTVGLRDETLAIGREQWRAYRRCLGTTSATVLMLLHELARLRGRIRPHILTASSSILARLHLMVIGRLLRVLLLVLLALLTVTVVRRRSSGLLLLLLSAAGILHHQVRVVLAYLCLSCVAV